MTSQTAIIDNNKNHHRKSAKTAISDEKKFNRKYEPNSDLNIENRFGKCPFSLYSGMSFMALLVFFCLTLCLCFCASVCVWIWKEMRKRSSAAARHCSAAGCNQPSAHTAVHAALWHITPTYSSMCPATPCSAKAPLLCPAAHILSCFALLTLKASTL